MKDFKKVIIAGIIILYVMYLISQGGYKDLKPLASFFKQESFIGLNVPNKTNNTEETPSLEKAEFTPYMINLQRQIKANWKPPKGSESKRIVVLFKIGKDGQLLSCKILKSSGLRNLDKSAIEAIYLTAPFEPLPVDFEGNSVEINFTFDYNIKPLKAPNSAPR